MGTPKTLSGVIAAMRKLIAAKENFACGSGAEDMRGRIVAPSDPGACAFCILGAAARVVGAPDWTDGRLLYSELVALLGVSADLVLGSSPDKPAYQRVYAANDDGGFEVAQEVMAVAYEMALGAGI